MPVFSLLKCGLPRFAACESGALASKALGAFVLGLGLAAAVAPMALFDDVAEDDGLSIVLIDQQAPSFARFERGPRTMIAALDIEEADITAN